MYIPSNRREIGDSLEKLHLPIIIEMDEDGVYIVSCPQLKGCRSYGETIEEAMENIKEAIALCLEDQNPSDINKFIGFRELEVLQ